MIKTFVGDFETTVYNGQVSTEVWASALVEMFTEDVHIFHSIADTFDYLCRLNSNLIVYYHNLKFDGAFWMSYLITELHFEQAIQYTESGTPVGFQHNKDMKNKTFKYTISDMGQWYTLTIKHHNHCIELRDSLKLLPFSVERIGKSFHTKHKKLSMEYKGIRYAGCEITDKEKEYIANDVLVVKEALEIMFKEGHNKLTIGACCLSEFHSTYDKKDYEVFFPDMYDVPTDPLQYGSTNADEYIRRSYKGGWCYLVKGKESTVYHNGCTADVNSLYPSMMSSESGNKYPVGLPHFWKGDIPPCALESNAYYFVRIRTRFYIKHNKLPCIQIKNNYLYPPTQWLETSDIYNRKTGEYSKYYYDTNGVLQPAFVTLTLTMTDYILIQEHYNLVDCEVLDGCWFHAEEGIFDRYINKYKKIKLESTGAIRELAKLFLNNLYGKMASSRNSSFKYAYEKDDESIGYVEVQQFDKKAGYIPIGSAITSYARNFTIRSAQKNFYGADKAGFIYADTDSIHCDLPTDQIKGIKVHDKDFCCWKLEAQWDEAIFVRQKTYIEHVVAENLEPIAKPYYNVKCAGMPTRCKDLFLMSMQGYTEEEYNTLNEVEKSFVSTKRDLEDFKIGLIVPSKLLPKTIRGGVLLMETTYEMR